MVAHFRVESGTAIARLEVLPQALFSSKYANLSLNYIPIQHLNGIFVQLQNAVMPASHHAEQDRGQVSLHDSRFGDMMQSSSTQTGSNGAQGIDTVGHEMEPSAADKLKTLVQECGVSPHKISELLQELPPLRSSDVLIDYYFKSM